MPILIACHHPLLSRTAPTKYTGLGMLHATEIDLARTQRLRILFQIKKGTKLIWLHLHFLYV